MQGGVAALGTHIFPLRLLGWPFELTSAIEVLRSYVTPIDDLEVLVTRMGGLFVRVPESLPPLFEPEPRGHMKQDFETPITVR